MGASPSSELPCESAEDAAPRSILRCKDADPGAAADLVDLVRHIDDIEARRQRATPADLEGVTQAQIDLRIARRVIAVRNNRTIGKHEVVAQPGSEEQVRAEARA